MRPYVVQIPEERWQMWVGFVGWLFFAYPIFMRGGSNGLRVAIYVLGAVAWGILSYRLYRAALVAADDGVTIRGVFKDVHVPWTDIISFSRGVAFVGPVVKVECRSGRDRKSIGTAAGSLVGGDESQAELLRAIDTLNRIAEDDHAE